MLKVMFNQRNSEEREVIKLKVRFHLEESGLNSISKINRKIFFVGDEKGRFIKQK